MTSQKEGVYYINFQLRLLPAESTMPNWNTLKEILAKRKANDLQNQHEVTATRINLSKEHLRKIFLMFPSMRITDLTPVTQKDGSLEIHSPELSNLIPFLTEYEGFLYSLMSCIDSFLLEVNEIACLKIPSDSVRVKTIRECLVNFQGDATLKAFLTAFLNAKWFDYLGKLRNLYAHYEVPYPTFGSDCKLYLPAKPAKAKPNSVVEYVDFFSKLAELFTNAMQSIELGFGHLKRLSENKL